MNIDVFTSLSFDGEVMLEITADDLLTVMKDFATETTNLLAKIKEGSFNDFISKSEAMKMLNLTRDQTLGLWEERGYLTHFDGDYQNFYLHNEVLLLKNFAKFLIAEPLKMKIRWYPDLRFRKGKKF